LYNPAGNFDCCRVFPLERTLAKYAPVHSTAVCGTKDTYEEFEEVRVS
jgi:hypothetical protein